MGVCPELDKSSSGGHPVCCTNSSQDDKMRTPKQKPAEALLAAVAATRPAKPALSSADKTYLRGLKRQGYTEAEIIAIAQSAGYDVPDNLFQPRANKKPPIG